MKIVYEFAHPKLHACGLVCDRCGTIQADVESAKPTESFVSVVIDYGRIAELYCGDFCRSCDEALQDSPGGWRPHMRSVAHFMPGRDYRGYRFQVRDSATAELRWIDSLMPEEELM